MTYNLRAMLKNETEKNDTVANYIAKKMGYLNASSISKFLNYEKYPNRECEKFTGLVAVVNEFFGDIAHEVMTDYAKTIKPTRETARYMLEYASSNNLKDLQSYLIDKMMYSKNTESEQWAKMYELDLEQRNKTLPEEEMIAKINCFESTLPELMAYKGILQSYYYYDKSHLTMLLESAVPFEKQIQAIATEDDSEKYIRNSYISRFALIMTGVYLHKNELVKCRELAERTLVSNVGEKVKSLMHLQIGHSYIRDDYKKAKESYYSGLKYLSSHDSCDQFTIDNFKRSVNFLNAHWAKAPEFIMEVTKNTDIQNNLYYQIRKGNLDKANSLLGLIKEKELTLTELGFNSYYKALLYGNKDLFYESVIQFKEADKYYYCEFPVNELKELGENQVVLRAIIA